MVVALGSNLGDRTGHLDYAVSCLRRLLADAVVSPFQETAPHGVDPAQPRYLNAVVVGMSTESPSSLLHQLRAVEEARGRERPYTGAPRTLDLDLILVGELVCHDPDLALPHPRFRERAFVLNPLAALAPDLVDPVTGLTIEGLARKLGALLEAE